MNQQSTEYFNKEKNIPKEYDLSNQFRINNPTDEEIKKVAQSIIFPADLQKGR